MTRARSGLSPAAILQGRTHFEIRTEISFCFALSPQPQRSFIGAPTVKAHQNGQRSSRTARHAYLTGVNILSNSLNSRASKFLS
jgi:hypothetical protein